MEALLPIDRRSLELGHPSTEEDTPTNAIVGYSGLRIILTQRLPMVIRPKWHIAGLVLAYGGGTALALNQASPFDGN